MHVIEIDERLREALADATDPHANVTLHWGDAMTIDLGGLTPAPAKLVANLPYGIAAGALLRSIEELPERAQLGGDGPARGRRAPRGRAGQPAPTARPRCSRSSSARCRCCGRSRARCSCRCRTWTRCSSACAAARGAAAAETAARRRCGRWSAAASPTAARRSPARSRSRAGSRALPRAGARGAGAAWATRRRARRATLARGLQGARAAAASYERLPRAGAREDQPRPVPRAHRARRTAVTSSVSVMQSISLADELTLEPAPAGAESDEVVCPGVAGPASENLAARALRAFRERTGWQAPPLRLEHRQAHPRRRRPGRGLGRRRRRAAPGARTPRASGDERLLLELAARARRRRSRAGRAGTLAGERGRGATAALARSARALRRAGAARRRGLSTAAVYARGRPARGWPARSRSCGAPARELRRRSQQGAPLPAASELLHNDLQAAADVAVPGDRRRARAGARGGGGVALLSGSGPTVLGLFADARASAPRGAPRAARRRRTGATLARSRHAGGGVLRGAGDAGGDSGRSVAAGTCARATGDICVRNNLRRSFNEQIDNQRARRGRAPACSASGSTPG